MNLDKYEKFLVPRVIKARLPYVGMALCLILLAVHLFNAGDAFWTWILAGGLAILCIHTSVYPTWMGFAAVAVLYGGFIVAFIATMASDYFSGQPYTEGALPQMLVTGLIALMVGWYFWRCRPRQPRGEDQRNVPMLGFRWLPIHPKKEEDGPENRKDSSERV